MHPLYFNFVNFNTRVFPWSDNVNLTAWRGLPCMTSSYPNITLLFGSPFVYLWEGKNISVSSAPIVSSKHWHNCSCSSLWKHWLYLKASATAGNMSSAKLQATQCIKYTGGKKVIVRTVSTFKTQNAKNSFLQDKRSYLREGKQWRIEKLYNR